MDGSPNGGAWVVNPWVDELRRSYRNSKLGNSGNRGFDSDFMKSTYVPTVLDTELTPRVTSGGVRVALICGNPGDGKTAYLETLERQLIGSGARSLVRRADAWMVSWAGREVMAVLDASESHLGEEPDARMLAALHWLEGDSGRTLLVAINDGRLQSFAERFLGEWPWLEGALPGSTVKLPGDILLIDLKHRSLVGPVHRFRREETHFLDQIMQELSRESHWQVCASCAGAAHCPIRRGAEALRDQDTRHRISTLFLISHLRRVRRVTIRDARSALAWTVTGDRGCHDIHRLYDGATREPDVRAHEYVMNLFTVPPEGDDTSEQLHQLDPADVVAPWLDREFRPDWEETPLVPDASGADAPTESQPIDGQSPDLHAQYQYFRRHRFFSLGKDSPSEGETGVASDHATDEPNVLDRASDWHRLLPYQHLEQYIDTLTAEEASLATRNTLLAGLSRATGVLPAMAAGRVALAVTRDTTVNLVVMKLFDHAGFNVSTTHQNAALPGMGTQDLVLSHPASGARVRLDLDLFELLMRLGGGESETAAEHGVIREELTAFIQRLFTSQTDRLVLWADDLGRVSVHADSGRLHFRQEGSHGAI